MKGCGNGAKPKATPAADERADPALFEAGRAAMAECKARLSGKTL